MHQIEASALEYARHKCGNPLAYIGRVPRSCTFTAKDERNPLDELRARLAEAVRSSPAQDLEKNLQALFTAFFDRFDLAAREDLDVQKKLLERAQGKLAALEARVAELETRKPGGT